MSTPSPRQILETLLPHLRAAAAYARYIQPKITALPVKEGDNFFAQALSDADLSIQNMVEVVLLGTFPNLRFYGEELDRSPNTKYFRSTELGPPGDYLVTLDPIDGTKGFLRKDQYAIALALIEDGEVKLGIMGCPAYPTDTGAPGMVFVAVRGEGATMKPIATGEFAPIRVVKADDGENMRFVESVEAAHGNQSRQNAIAQAVGITSPSVRMDSQAKYGAVASGQAALYLRLPSPKYPDYRENIWDHAAGAIVVEEAGGRVTDMNGKPLDFASDSKMHDNRGVVVSNGIIHDTVLAALKG